MMTLSRTDSVMIPSEYKRTASVSGSWIAMVRS